eukprot:CAMPEP_0194524614 /NCGR_PEP_ID=MMETSP0253-20130528/59837_1 /TAXON_ID=2966 /ORGANISM="Noctiluca scintillans" /LENGTH=72 /DNA_ID=CAMNT_0039369259 /DNA_START=185 /DNA_END=403 /DNA_ORIENTATION=+
MTSNSHLSRRLVLRGASGVVALKRVGSGVDGAAQTSGTPTVKAGPGDAAAFSGVISAGVLTSQTATFVSPDL